MRTRWLALVLMIPLWAAAHPHEWVDWSAGLVLDEKKPLVVKSVTLELTWDEWLSSLVMTDFPAIRSNTMRPADLTMLDTTYGLGSGQRASSLTVSWKGKPLKLPKPIPLPPVAGAKTVTLVYSIPINLKVDAASELRVSLYDPTYYTDMGISAKKGGFFSGVADPAKYAGAFSFEQDFDHPYYGGVFPEVVVFALKN